MNATGIAQATTAADLLVGHGITRIVASPLIRARATAAIVADKLGLPVTIIPELHEVSFGEMEGKPMLAQWFSDWIAGAYTPAGAESFADLRIRTARVINGALSAPPPILFVAHGAIFRALRANMGLDPQMRLPNAIPQFCLPPAPGETTWNITGPKA